MRSILKQFVAQTAWYILIACATALMLRTIIGYAGFDMEYAFLAKKQAYLHNKVWLVAFYTHVFTSIFTLLAAFTQFSKNILLHNPRIHRFTGKIYVAAVIFINFPSGLIMAIYANGLWPSKLAFFILDALWFYFTFKGWRTAVAGDFKNHRRWMIRSYALTFSAITLRTWRLILDPFIESELTLYMIDAWMGFVPNLVFAELYLRRLLPMKIKKEHIYDGYKTKSAHT